MVAHRFLFFGLLLWVFACGSVTAQDVVTQHAYLEDPQGVLTLEQVKGADFSESGKIISLGYTRATVWVRLDVMPLTDAKALAVRIFPAHLDDVVLFSDSLPHEGLRLSGRTTWFANQSGIHAYYLRIKTHGPMLLAPRILSEKQAHAEDVSHGVLMGAVLTCSVLVLGWLLVLTVRRRQMLHVVLFVNLSLVVSLFFAWTGHVHAWLQGDVIYFLGLLNILTGFTCCWLIFQQLGVARWCLRLLMLPAVVYLPLLLLFFMLDRQWVLQASTFLGLLASLMGLFLTVLVFQRHQRHQRSNWLIGLALLLAMGLSARWFLTLHAYLAPVDSLPNLLFFRIFFAMFFVAVALLFLNRERRHQMQALMMNTLLERQRVVSETQRRETQERFMTMLMHELKTPLSIIQLAASSLGRGLSPDSSDALRIQHINRSVDDLNALVECCAHADQVEQGAMALQKETLCLGSLVREVVTGMNAARLDVQAPVQLLVSADAHGLRLILLNLLSNALKYSPPLSQVVLELKALAGEARVCSVRIVNEVGSAGVPDPALLFSRYYRAEGARRQVGAGLGLWLAQALARQMGSELTFHHSHNQLVFGFYLELA